MKSKANRKTVGHCKAYSMTTEQIAFIEGNVGAKLERFYPGYLWMIEVEGPILHVSSPIVNKVYGFTMKLGDIDVDMHKIMLAAGEILERSRLTRGKAKLSELYNAKRNPLGDITPDLNTGSAELEKVAPDTKLIFNPSEFRDNG